MAPKVCRRSATRAAAAQARTSAGTTITVRSANSSAARAGGGTSRGRSHTTTSPPRRLADTTAATASGSGAKPFLAPDNNFTPAHEGRADRSDEAATRPDRTPMSGQRSPFSFSTPSTRSRPPANGSQSTSIEE
ncbi:hypothetical protein GCM10029964_001150 [Kibdelosporangium lantanae]